ncbi:hypothetical protein GGR56DRAFT_530825 [Xylariaceae sp. FL0804]|nr:hypothetical protein GGR56DRAFT_530825 [Xylariaceae sp. FL0804]
MWHDGKWWWSCLPLLWLRTACVMVLGAAEEDKRSRKGERCTHSMNLPVASSSLAILAAILIELGVARHIPGPMIRCRHNGLRRRSLDRRLRNGGLRNWEPQDRLRTHGTLPEGMVQNSLVGSSIASVEGAHICCDSLGYLGKHLIGCLFYYCCSSSSFFFFAFFFVCYCCCCFCFCCRCRCCRCRWGFVVVVGGNGSEATDPGREVADDAGKVMVAGAWRAIQAPMRPPTHSFTTSSSSFFSFSSSAFHFLSAFSFFFFSPTSPPSPSTARRRRGGPGPRES